MQRPPDRTENPTEGPDHRHTWVRGMQMARARLSVRFRTVIAGIVFIWWQISQTFASLFPPDRLRREDRLWLGVED